MSLKFNFLSLLMLIFSAFMLYNCRESSDVKEGLKVIHFPKSDAVKQTIEYKNGKKNGYLKEYFRNGTLKARQFFVNDSLDDTTYLYHENGKLKATQIFKSKLKHGCWREYNKEGVLFSEIYFKDDFLDSTCCKYSYRTHRLLTRITYNKGLKNGYEEHFYPSGKPQSKVLYDMGQICKGTEEWHENGEKIDNDFKINVIENDALLLENTLSYTIRLENNKPTDLLYQVVGPDEGNKIGSLLPVKKVGDVFVFDYTISKGGFVMEKVTVAAFRKTNLGNTFVKTQSFNVASNNF
jgi:hypothetical protein